MTEQEEYKPKWLLELENRKRKQHLGHETGAGAPCLACESACPGLDLHFWRKICKNCKCRGDDHDFDDDEFPQFELLFGPGVKSKKKNRTVLLPVADNKKQVPSETPFEWVPPNTTKELAADYMKALPSDKLPITGSPGAALRRQQLQKQLPLHDIDHKACDGLSEEERQEFDKYLNNLKRCAGQGKVSKLMTIKPFDPAMMTPANATDIQHPSPEHSQQLSKHLNGVPNLRTPSSFIPKGLPPRQQEPASSEFVHSRKPSSIADEEYARGTAQCPASMPGGVGSEPVAPSVDAIRAQQSQAASESNPRLGRYHHHHHHHHHHHASASLSASDANVAQAAGAPGAYQPGSGRNNHLPNTNSRPHELRRVGNPGLLTANGEYCASGRRTEPLAAEAHRLESLRLGQTSTERSDDLPTSSSARLAEELLSQALLPPSAIRASDIVGSSLDEQGLAHIREKLSDKYSNKGDQQQQQQQQQQSMTTAAPRNDLEQTNSLQHPATASAVKAATAATAASAMISASSADIKRSAEIARELESQPTSQMDVSARNQQPARGQPAQLNSSLPVQSSVIHSEALNNPVFPEECVGGAATAYQNPDNISQMRDEMQATKMSSWKMRECYRCQDDIYPGQVVVTADKIKDAVWHPGCFKCCACNELLVDLVYFTYKGRLYCGRDLAKLLEIPRCHACDELIFVQEYTVAEGNNYHVKHFCCWDCDTPLANKLYVTENDRPLCLPCYQRYYAKTCNACNGVIAADQQGVAIKDLNFHTGADCFCCVTCKKSLLGGQIAIKENKLLCSKECIAEFLHRRKMGR